MKPRYTDEEYLHASYADKLACECEQCGELFYATKRHIYNALKYFKYKDNNRFCSKTCFAAFRHTQLSVKCEVCGTEFKRNPYRINANKHQFCSQECKHKHQTTRITIKCDYCGANLTKFKSAVERTEHHFCNKSCQQKYANSHGTGTSRSKLEIYLEEQLTRLYPELSIEYNQKNTINSELDIYIPSLKLAFELNGVFHYEPIFGAERLSKIQNNDQRKFQACLERGIELCNIDASSMSRFNENKARMFLQITTNIIETKMGA
jgi:hypothetical protein